MENIKCTYTVWDNFVMNHAPGAGSIRAMIHNKINLISPSCPRPNIALQVQNHDLKHQSFHFSLAQVVPGPV